MSLNLSENEFTEKYGFALHDFYYICIDKIISSRYFCYSIRELAYDIADKIYQEIGSDEDKEFAIMYKQTESMLWGTKIYTHNIAISYEDIYITFKVGWDMGVLIIKAWDMVHKEEIEKDEQYEDIECLEEELECED